jgi:phosphoglycolate phosphatase
MIKAVIFDFDDTIVNTFEPKARALQKTARDAYNFELTREAIKKHWGKPYHEMLLLLFEEVTDDLDDILKNFEEIRHSFPAEVLGNVKETIAKLQGKVVLGILTSSSKPLILRDLELIDLSPDNFFHIQTFEDTDYHKPDPKVFEPMLHKLAEQNIAKEEIVYVGDALTDFLAARGAGLKFYGVTNAITSKEKFEKASAQVLDDIKELVPLVRE